MENIFKNRTKQFIDLANGIDNSPIITNNSVKSLSSSTTLNNDISDYEQICLVFQMLANDLSIRMKKNRVLTNSISISIRYFDFRTINRSIKLDQYTNASDILYQQSLLVYDRNESDQYIRHLGISTNNLVSEDSVIEQLNLFDSNINYSIDEIISTLNSKMNKDVFKKLSKVGKDDGKQTIN